MDFSAELLAHIHIPRVISSRYGNNGLRVRASVWCLMLDLHSHGNHDFGERTDLA